MIIQIHGTGTHNRGAELMALAISEHVRAVDPSTWLVVDQRFGSFEDRARYQLRLTNDFPIKTSARWIGTIASSRFRDAVGLVPRSHVDAILDASGFAFSDQWGPRPAESLVREMQRVRRRGQMLLLLPQAFGPFKNHAVADAVKKLLNIARLVFARDRESYDALLDLDPNARVRLCPDFTQTLKPAPVNAGLGEESYCAIVPNIRMIDKGRADAGHVYLNFLAHCVAVCRERGLKPVLLLHDAREDKQLVPAIEERVGRVDTFESPDPLVLKGLLGQAMFVIGSRYHALVSALSQGVPCIGAGWSHKYLWLFRDFGCEEFLLHELSDRSTLTTLVDNLSGETARAVLAETIQRRAQEQRKQIEAMWKEVDECLGFTKGRLNGSRSSAGEVQL